MRRRPDVVLVVLMALGVGCAQPPAPPAASAPIATPDVVELAATDARDRMAAGTLTSCTLTQAYLYRIAAIDDAGPRLNAVIELDPKALAQAEALDAERT
jgi:amidase